LVLSDRHPIGVPEDTVPNPVPVLP
jgi:hypothetical protein